MDKTTVEKYPDITIVSEDGFRDKLDIIIDKDNVEFVAHVDGNGNRWDIKKKVLKLMLR